MYEGDGRNVKFIKEYRTSWLSYSKISQFADFVKNGELGKAEVC